MKWARLLNQDNDLKVTAVVPVYNGGSYLIETINSILAQKNSNYKIVIINDGSNQETEKIVTTLTKESSGKIDLIQNEYNRGATRALYQGFEYAAHRDDFILTLAQDDVLPDFYLSSVIKTFKKRNTVAVYTNLIPIDSNGEILKGIIAGPMTSVFGKYQTAWVFGLNLIGAPGSIISKGIYPHEYLKGEYPYTHDLHLWLHLSTMGRIRVSGKSNCFYRLHSESITAKRNFKDFHIELTKNRLEFIQSPTFTKYVKSLRGYQRHIFYALVNLATSRESYCEHRFQWDEVLRNKLGLQSRLNFQLEKCISVKVSSTPRKFSRKKTLHPRNEPLNHINSLTASIRVLTTSSYFLFRKFLIRGFTT
jgi:glycosyltransferase involved in cell wall biosynthesis